jgi:uncharacterized protein YndB with AHSA1/START domain
MTNAMPSNQASVTVFVEAPIDVAFTVFTEETDLWWRHGRKYRIAGKHPGTLQFEPKAGGRLFETWSDSRGNRMHEIGRILAWEPPSRLMFEWRGVNFAEGESTEVEVAFRAIRDGTEVKLTHRGWAAFRDDHPVRHGQTGAAFIRSIGMWWADLLAAYRGRAGESVDDAKAH